jgi:hypothetical protein
VLKGLGSSRGLWEVSALRASVPIQRLRLLGHINPGAINWHTGLAVACRLAWGSLKQGKCRRVVPSIFPLLFGPCVELDFHNKVLKFVRYAHWDLRSYAATAP